MQEFRTAKIAADYLTKYHYEVSTGIGVTGVVGLMKNGEGPTVMLRADMDALPVAEATGLPYASTKVARNDVTRMRSRPTCNMVNGCCSGIF